MKETSLLGVSFTTPKLMIDRIKTDNNHFLGCIFYVYLPIFELLLIGKHL